MGADLREVELEKAYVSLLGVYGHYGVYRHSLPLEGLWGEWLAACVARLCTGSGGRES